MTTYDEDWETDAETLGESDDEIITAEDVQNMERAAYANLTVGGLTKRHLEPKRETPPVPRSLDIEYVVETLGLYVDLKGGALTEAERVNLLRARLAIDILLGEDRTATLWLVTDTA
ncbi:MAG: hypothetical protein ABI595_06360 [Actinomycetota bacterium]